MRINVMYFIAYAAFSSLIGIAILVSISTRDWAPVATYATCFAGLLLGYLMFPQTRAPGAVPTIERANATTALENASRDRGVYAVVGATGILALYHLVASGIPLFSSEIEVARFDFTSSGFFGVPGRMYLYGVPIAWILATTAAFYRGIRWHRYPPWVLATGFYTLVSLLSGFKSGLSAMFTMMAIFAIQITGARITAVKLARKYWPALAAAVLYGLYVAASYRTYQNSGTSTFRSIVDRLTVVGAEPKLYALQGNIAISAENAIHGDFQYFISKYTGMATEGRYSFERAVSAHITGVDPSSDAWTTPVTVGGIPELVFSLGPYVSILAFFAIGVGVRRIQGGIFTFRRSVVCAVIIYTFYMWITRGGLAYYLINLFAVSTLLTVLYSIARVTTVRADLRTAIPIAGVTGRSSGWT